jgi:hypothetical protein
LILKAPSRPFILPQGSLHREAVPFQQAERPNISRRDESLDTIQAHSLESEIEGRAYRFAHEPPAPAERLEFIAEFGSGMFLFPIVETARPDDAFLGNQGQGPAESSPQGAQVFQDRNHLKGLVKCRERVEHQVAEHLGIGPDFVQPGGVFLSDFP